MLQEQVRLSARANLTVERHDTTQVNNMNDKFLITVHFKNETKKISVDKQKTVQVLHAQHSPIACSLIFMLGIY